MSAEAGITKMNPLYMCSSRADRYIDIPMWIRLTLSAGKSLQASASILSQTFGLLTLTKESLKFKKRTVNKHPQLMEQCFVGCRSVTDRKGDRDERDE